MDEKLTICENRKTDNMYFTKVKFCVKCDGSDKCKQCDKLFDRRKSYESTSFHQIQKDITGFMTENAVEMIVDLRCPNSVISRDDFQSFKQNLS